MILRSGVWLLLAALTLLTEGQQRGAPPDDDEPPKPFNVRRLLGSGRRAEALSTRSAIQEEDLARNQVLLTDPTPLVLAQVVKELGGGVEGRCHVLIYYEPQTAPEESLDALQKELNVPVTLVDVSKLRFPLITMTRRRVPLVDLLTARPNERCRLMVGWASDNYQRGLLLIARAETGVLRPRDTLILPVSSQRLDRFLPQLRQRVLVKRRGARGGRGRRDLTPARFLVEQTCETCSRYALDRLGEWQHPGGWEWGGVASRSPKLSGVELRVAYTPSVPNIFWVAGEGEPRLEGVELRLLEYAAQALNFSFRLTIPSDGEWGRPINGTWTGKVGDVVSGRADMAVGGIVYTEERADAAEYSILFHNELWGIVCPLSERLPVWPYIMFPFRADAAPSVFASLVVLHVLAYLVGTLLGAQVGVAPRHELMDAVARVTQTGVSLYLRLLACLYFWNLFFCIMKPKYEPPVDSATALLSSGYHWGIVSGTTVTRVLSTSRHVEHKELAADAEDLPSIRDGFLRLRQRGMCLVGVPKRYARATIAMRYTTECGEEGLQVSTEDLHSVLGGWLLPRHSRLTPLLDSIIRRLQTFGLIEHWRQQMQELLITRGPRSLPCLNPPIAALTLSDLRLAFVFLLAGWGISALIFLAEQVVFAFSARTYERDISRRRTAVGALLARGPRPPPPPPTPRTSPQPSLGSWLRELLSPIPTIDAQAKEAAFRNHLDAILRELWGISPP